MVKNLHILVTEKMIACFTLKTPVYITDEFGAGEALLITLFGIGMIFLAKLLANSENSFVSAFGEVFIFKLGIGISLTGIISFIISLF